LTVADHAELHTHLNDNGVMKMRQIPDIPVEAGATVKLQPGGLHIMLMDLKQPLKEGDKIPMTLRFEKAGEVKVDVHVDKVGAMPAAAGAHAGH
jgi:copper(I)-binding protein